ncbi:MAG: Histidyl-tRNA synthetase [Candidatus Amesbacteria bacterium GW2011_GWA2_47_11b]|uniref:Histidine--tRNA ligase n=2 Tax=Candidatus Amesiibacteriota TaxID=1752730 RepID=A0A0G1SL61_9BACT|nr:MAG: Histidyl-tRNA synthetase [Candidatus Amesbacteria bacterium GW2011_GWA2_47_11b]KKU70229.1 MAG: Histidyl-tRNA synthetase [Candidatus Amesbacteria bacterium GW2011_GWA1_47_20]
MSTIQTLKGFRDFLPETMAVRSRVINILKTVFEKYGFSELQTPTLEYAEVLTGKYGQEAEKLMYLFQDPGGRKVGLKYDMTVPLARVMAQYPDLPKPFKRYQIQPAFRAENTQKSRYRELYQCDVDTVGTLSPLADAEILAIISDALTGLGFKEFKIRVNSRQILFGITKDLSVLQSIDKLDKKSANEVKQELSQKGLSPDEIQNIFAGLDSAKPDPNLTQIMDIAEKLGARNIEFDPRLVRGLDYYTGVIFETMVTEPKIGSITGGGRYDNLIKSLGGPDLPAVGTTLGLDRICDVIEELTLWPDLPKSATKILVTIFSQDLYSPALILSSSLRDAGINTELYPDASAKLDKQLKYANAKGIPYVAIIGPEEAAQNEVKVKNMATGEQKCLPEQELISFFS